MVLPKYTLTDKLWEYLQAYAEKHKSRGNGFGFGLVWGKIQRGRYLLDISRMVLRLVAQ